ncbi:MAG: SelB C-terminal domain-containing protein, partial [Enterobacteriaceae bacterium]
LDQPAQTQCNVQMALKGYTPCHRDLSPPPDSHLLGEWWVAQHHYQHCLKVLNRMLQRATSALSIDELAQQINAPLSLLEPLVEQQCQAQQWQRTASGITLMGADLDLLSSEQQALLQEIELAGRKCFDAAQQQRPLLQQQLKTLMEKKRIIPMEDKLFLTCEHYQNLIEEIVADQTVGALFSIAEARESTGLARKQLIPLLNRMERDGWVKRMGDQRRIQKIA